MKLFITVLIAAATLNCLVTVINGRAATDTLAVPYIDTLLPPLKDIQDDSTNASAKINATAKGMTVSITTTSTTKKPITNDDNNILPELSIEALVPPLFEAKIEKEETTTIPTTTYRTTTTTIKPRITTKKSSTTTSTTLKTLNLKPNDLFLDALLPPLFNNSSIDAKEAKVTTTRPTTQKPITTTKKSYHQQQTKYSKQQENIHTKHYPRQQQKLKHVQIHSASSGVKNYNNKIATTNERHVAESQTHQKQVFLTSQLEKDTTEKAITQYVTKQVALTSNNNNNNNKHDEKRYNYNFDSYFGSTTTRPPKSGLPTITPFPRNLGR